MTIIKKIMKILFFFYEEKYVNGISNKMQKNKTIVQKNILMTKKALYPGSNYLGK